MTDPRHLIRLVLVVSLSGCSPEANSPGRSSSAPAPQDRVSIHLNKTDGETKATFDVRGLEQADLARLRDEAKRPDWSQLFAVYVDNSSKADPNQPAVLGSYRIEDGVLRFEPRFPLTPGVSYRAELHYYRFPGREQAPNAPEVIVFEIPKLEQIPTTVVQHVYPTANKLPENQLKFYIHFSAPMSRGEAYDHIHLLDAAGKEIELVFLELGEELWDPQVKRFTLFIDPGRIKRGLKPREDLGPALEEGKSYTLVIDPKWTDAQGNPLKEPYRKRFQVGKPDEQQPDPKSWKLEAPRAGTREPLTLILPEPMDHALLERLPFVINAEDGKIRGTVAISQEETRWQFTPESPWVAGSYHLVVATFLEDLAGNSIGRPFEVDEFKPISRKAEMETVKIPFQVQGP